MVAKINRKPRSFSFRLRAVLSALLCLAVLLSSELVPLSVFAVGQDVTVISDKCRAADGNAYKVTASFSAETGIPHDAVLRAQEIPETDARYAAYMADTQAALLAQDDAFAYALVLDISIVDKNNPDLHYQPAEGTTVDVQIHMADETALDGVNVLHFADDADAPQAIPLVDIDGKDLCFAADGFSAYVIVSGPSGVMEAGWQHLTSISDLREVAESGFYVGHSKGFFFTNGITQISGTRTGITKTKPAQATPPSDAKKYYFEFLNENSDQFRAYCYNAQGSKVYVRQSSNSLNLVEESNATVFTLEEFPDSPGYFRVRGNDGFFWNMQGGDAGKSFAAFQSSTDVNAKLEFLYYLLPEFDPYSLDGKTFSLMSYNGGLTAKAMMAESSAANQLDALNLVVLSQEEDREQRIFVPNDSDATEWTFECVEGDYYYLKTSVNGSTKYLKITGSGLMLVDTPDASCSMQVVAGTGTHSGQICLRTNGNTLTYSGSIDTGFRVGGTAGSEWLYLVEESDLTSDYLMKYSARKVSVSDQSVTNGSRVILYTRVWNNADKRYDFYAVDHDGTLVPCYESGDNIEWVGNRINTLLWNLVEYYWEGTNEPNYYYELYNQYSEQFIAPQVTDGQILSDDVIGINLNGRRNGYYYTPILAWDDNYYAYAGLKVEGDHIVSCPKSQTDDFYFAIINDIPPDDSLTLVDTIDNNQFGITMRMIDFTDKPSMISGTLLNEQDETLGDSIGGLNYPPRQGLLSTDLDENGYPTAVLTGTSFADLYSTSTPANHLFIQSIYNASGYFEFNSTQNFASLDGTDFKVYQELGTMDNASRPSLKHGQFMPYNDLQAGLFSSANAKNLYDANQDELPATDPRKAEQMYLVKNPDYYFGMELEASFIQTPNGHDAWGHDIVYEFAGDDDFWLYVDGELVIDLGGIHSAMPGTVNFCTGQVTMNGQPTTLRDIFYNNYISRGHTQQEAQAYIEENFQQNSSGQWVFKDYTSHTMRIFYMERGAGASNLHMRFNLASVKEGTVLLSKELGNVDETESLISEYPYQIWYRKAEDSTDYLLVEDDLNIKVYYKDTVNPVAYKPSLTIDGHTYQSVFMLKPNEIAEINLPDDAISYRIVECGIDTDIYDSVLVNGTPVEGTAVSGNDYREDYGIPYETARDRSRVIYRNNVDPSALRNLTIEKKLYDETGVNELHNDPTTFTFRLYLGSGFEEELPAANMVTYHVKNENGEYCSWNAAQQKFISLGAGKTDYTALSAAEKAAASFTTSMNGSISKIPAFYTVEFRNMLAGMQYKVEERDYEIPDGYSRQKYVHYLSGVGTTGTDSLTPVSGVFIADEDPHVDVCNLRGWGLRMYKQWTDANYMDNRDPAYFAIFADTGESSLQLIDGTVRRLLQNERTLYWYFQTLPIRGLAFDHYEIREVSVTNPTVDSSGVVTAYDAVVPIAEGGEVHIEGRQKGENDDSVFTYTVLYDKGNDDDDNNVRVDNITNNRPGIILKKMQWDGVTPLAGAVFTLEDSSHSLIGTFTSDAEGLITIAFLRDNVDYTLTETRTPQGYAGLTEPLTLRLNNGTVTVTGADNTYYALTQGNGTIPTLIVKNRPYNFRVVKEDADAHTPLSGVHFALHRQVTVDGVTTIDFNPMTGYGDLVTDANGLVPRLDATLPAGTYELRENVALNGYQALSSHINFTVTRTGEIIINSAPQNVTFLQTAQNDGSLTYTITIPNAMRKQVSVWKTGPDYSSITIGATFALYDAADYDDNTESPSAGAEPILTGTTGYDGILSLGGLANGSYRLVETSAPAGYYPLTSAIRITVTSESVTAEQNGRAADVDRSGSAHFVTGQDASTWQIRVWNNPGTILPQIGGIGTHWLYLAGGVLLTCGTAMLYRKKRADEAQAEA